jgi:hypothetical protein
MPMALVRVKPEFAGTRLFRFWKCPAVPTIAPAPGRPRWATYDPDRDCVYVNVREPAEIVVIDCERVTVARAIEVHSAGPHGLCLDRGRLFCAADAGELVVLSDQGMLGEQFVFGRRELAVGDRVICRRNDALLDVDNGTRGTVRHLDEHRVVIETDSRLVRELPAQYVAEHVEHAYALTGHACKAPPSRPRSSSRHRLISQPAGATPRSRAPARPRGF